MRTEGIPFIKGHLQTGSANKLDGGLRFETAFQAMYSKIIKVQLFASVPNPILLYLLGFFSYVVKICTLIDREMFRENFRSHMKL